MPTRKSTKNTIKNYLANLRQLRATTKQSLMIFSLDLCRSEGHPKYNRKLFYILKNLDEINAASVTKLSSSVKQPELNYELPSDKYCALLAVMCKVNWCC